MTYNPNRFIAPIVGILTTISSCTNKLESANTKISTSQEIALVIHENNDSPKREAFDLIKKCSELRKVDLDDTSVVLVQKKEFSVMVLSILTPMDLYI
jgi:hypothetical protein